MGFDCYFLKKFMFDYLLFFGIPISEPFQLELDKIPENVRSLFLKGNEYLQLIETEGISYIGKCLGDSTDFSSLELAQAHVFSLLKLLVPKHAYDKNELVLVTIPSELSS